ncbi:helix-turn-helix domain-containing protein [Hymenobacter edaphi]|uniref:DNA-binding protein n=1 Tax=Hymenobacter edaphi TaxID=2211146 RepID=A0A328B3N5_9BACT|nr:helix-turn-helix domain-containing protein [Hymenobacter edaphi]RAK61990.1 DNA-binding protein [Hymenobacter edaphi]
MEAPIEFLSIKQAAQLYGKSEQTIRRLVKQHVKTSHVRTEATPKGNAYLISQAFLQEQYLTSQATTQTPTQPEQLPAVIVSNQAEEVAQLQQQLLERDQTIQQLQSRLLEQNDVLNALTNQMNSQRIGHIEELLLRQNEQLGELQKRLPEVTQNSSVITQAAPPKPGFWKRLFGG